MGIFDSRRLFFFLAYLLLGTETHMKFNARTLLTGNIVSLCYWKGRCSGLSKYLPCFCFLGRDFQVNVTTESTFAAGKPLELLCLVVGSGRDPQLQGTWLFNGVEMASIDAGGVLGLKEDYKERAREGQLQVSKLSPKAFSLKIFAAGPKDEGAYRCAVAEVTRAQVGSWQVLQRKQSPDSHVHLRKPAGMWSRDQTPSGCFWILSFMRTGYHQGCNRGLSKSQVPITSLWGESKGKHPN